MARLHCLHYRAVPVETGPKQNPPGEGGAELVRGGFRLLRRLETSKVISPILGPARLDTRTTYRRLPGSLDSRPPRTLPSSFVSWRPHQCRRSG